MSWMVGLVRLMYLGTCGLVGRFVTCSAVLDPCQLFIRFPSPRPREEGSQAFAEPREGDWGCKQLLLFLSGST